MLISSKTQIKITNLKKHKNNQRHRVSVMTLPRISLKSKDLIMKFKSVQNRILLPNLKKNFVDKNLSCNKNWPDNNLKKACKLKQNNLNLEPAQRPQLKVLTLQMSNRTDWQTENNYNSYDNKNKLPQNHQDQQSSNYKI